MRPHLDRLGAQYSPHQALTSALVLSDSEASEPAGRAKGTGKLVRSEGGR
jgi:hypothetical protein